MADNQPMEPDDEDIAAYAAQHAITDAAWKFAEAYWTDGDLRAAWIASHPTLRRCWAQTWLMPMREQARAEGLEPDEVVEAFTADEVDHPLWEPFARTTIRGADLPVNRDTWGIKLNPDFVAPDVALLRLLPTPSDGVIHPGEHYVSVPLLMQYEDGPGWRLLNLVSEWIPEPGWPPNMGA
ncbi:hypothetical protein [Streptomyces mirabilis]